jgi:hypothetical protein
MKKNKTYSINKNNVDLQLKMVKNNQTIKLIKLSLKAFHFYFLLNVLSLNMTKKCFQSSLMLEQHDKPHSTSGPWVLLKIRVSEAFQILCPRKWSKFWSKENNQWKKECFNRSTGDEKLSKLFPTKDL